MTDQVNEAVSTPSEAVYAFGALLTTLSGSLTIGATHDASVMAQMCEAFRVANSWEPPRDNYTDYLARTSLDHLLPEAAHPSRGVVDEAMVERGARAAWEMVPRGVPWRDANDTIQDDWVRIARVILQAAALPAAPTRNMEQVRSEAFNLADTVIEWIESGNVQAARDAIRDSLVAHAAPPAVPDTWQERLRAEYAELDERFTKLCAFLESERFASLHEDDRRILMAQGNGMRAYLNALTFRVDQLDYAATQAHDQPEGKGDD